jgi:disulfide bond formation protein DsbB
VVATPRHQRYIIAMTTPDAGSPIVVWTIPLAILAASVGSLATAFAAQYLFGLDPCILCLYQRIPYAVTVVLAAAALVTPTRGPLRPGLVTLCAVVFFAGAALAFYHVGVEQHWWGSIAGCGGELATDLSLEDLKAQLTEGFIARKPCDRVAWELFGLSLAGYNGIASLALGVACLAGARLIRRGARS